MKTTKKLPVLILLVIASNIILFGTSGYYFPKTLNEFVSLLINYLDIGAGWNWNLLIMAFIFGAVIFTPIVSGAIFLLNNIKTSPRAIAVTKTAIIILAITLSFLLFFYSGSFTSATETGFIIAKLAIETFLILFLTGLETKSDPELETA